MSQESTTSNLGEILSKINDKNEMEKYWENPKITDSFSSFVPYYRSLLTAKLLTDTDIINKSGIEKSYYYQLMKESRKPSRDKVLCLCIAAGLNMRETTRALELNGSATLYPKNKRDIIITVGINQKAALVDINLLLDKYNEEPLA